MKNDNTNETKFVENNAIIIILFVILAIATPYVTSIIGTTWKKADETSTKGTIETAKLIYASAALTSDATLPFKIVYDKNGYTLYSCNEKINLINPLNVKTEGQKPNSGTVTIKVDGTVKVKNLRFGILKCNSDKNERVTCKL